ncbi:MAG TPA: hypothetical protein VGM67_09960 [Gemmatimonadaceae bacterium]
MSSMLAAPTHDGTPELVPEIVPGVLSAVSGATALSAEQAAGIGTGLWSEHERDTASHRQAQNDTGRKYQHGPVVVGVAGFTPAGRCTGGPRFASLRGVGRRGGGGAFGARHWTGVGHW